MSNSIKFTEKGHISLNIRTASESELQFCDLPTNKAYTGFFVEDTGKGISKSLQKEIFS